MPLNSAGELLCISESNVYRWDREFLEKTLPEPNLDELKYLLVDEKSVRRGHNYVTLVMNGENGELLYMAEGKKKKSLKGFFDLLNKGQKATVKAVAMDRAGSYYQVVREELPKADIVFDKFHLIANFNAVIDEVRRIEWHKASKADKALLKASASISTDLGTLPPRISRSIRWRYCWP
jgi:transposase